MSGADSRIGFSVSSTPAPEHISYTAGAICEVLAAGAQHRTAESVVMAALDVLRGATQSAPITLHNARAEMGDAPVTTLGSNFNGEAPPAPRR